MACTKETVKSSGLNIWSGEAAAGPAHVVDIIAVQGLGAHPYHTWVKKAPSADANKSKRFKDRAQFWKSKKPQDRDGEDGSTEVMWLRDLLVPIFQNARIATYGYESDWRDPHVKTSLRECADQFLNILYQRRQHANERRRPLVLIGHSLGSLVIQQALVNAVHRREFTDLRLSVAGIIFLGAPFQGSDAAIFGKWLARLSRLDSTLLEKLRKGNPDLFALSTDFCSSYTDWDLVCFYEKKEATYLGLLKTQVVSSQSATLLGRRSIFLNTDHSGLNKFGREDDENFALVLPEIQRMVENGPSIVSERHRAKDSDATSHGNKHWMVPRPINDLFTGRTKLLLRMQKALHINHASPADKQKRFVITGLGGQGKSEICLKVASVMREEFWGVFWVDVGKASTAKSDFITIAKMLGRPAESVSDALQVLATAKQSWLLILDNADDPDFDYQLYLPSGTHGTIIVTSRIPKCKRYNTVGAEALEGLEDEQSQELLLKAAEFPRESWPSHSSQAKEVVRLLGSHTLALIQADAYIARGHCQLHQYPEVYRRRRKRLLEFRPKQAQSRYCDVHATFEASADVLEKFESEAAKDALHLLEILSMLDSTVLPLQIFKDAWDESREVLRTNPAEARAIDTLSLNHLEQLPGFMVKDSDEWDPYRLIEASSLLASLSLVTRHDLDISPGLSMHPLTHAWAKERQGPEQQSMAWITAGCVLALSRSNRNTWQTQERRLLPHIQSYLDIRISKVLSFGSKAIAVPILLKCGLTLLDMRQDSRLGRLLEDMFLELGKNPEEASQESLPLYVLQAGSLSHLGKYQKAEQILRQTLEIREKVLGKEHLDTLRSMNNLANILARQGKHGEAEQILRQTLKLIEKMLGKEHPDTLNNMNNLANVLARQGKHGEAEQMHRQTLELREKVLGREHPDTLSSMTNLALMFKNEGKDKEAEQILRQTLELMEKVLGKEHPDTLRSMNHLASTLQGQRQYKEAEQILRQTLELMENVLGKEHPDTLRSMDNLANILDNQWKDDEAEQIYRQTLELREKVLGKEHPDTLSSMNCLAVMLSKGFNKQEKAEEAKQMHRQTLELREKVLGREHPDTLGSMNTLAVVLRKQGKNEEAEQMHRQTLELMEKVLGKEHPYTLNSMNNLAVVLGKQGFNNQEKGKEAEQMYRQTLELREKVLGREHPDTLSSLSSLSDLIDMLNSQRSKEEAVALIEKHSQVAL